MITRTEGDDWIVLQSEDNGYNVQPGQVFRWADSFCSHMVQGKAPRIAPRSGDIPLYVNAPIAKQVEISIYWPTTHKKKMVLFLAHSAR